MKRLLLNEEAVAGKCLFFNGPNARSASYQQLPIGHSWPSVKNPQAAGIRLIDGWTLALLVFHDDFHIDFVEASLQRKRLKRLSRGTTIDERSLVPGGAGTPWRPMSDGSLPVATRVF